MTHAERKARIESLEATLAHADTLTIEGRAMVQRAHERHERVLIQRASALTYWLTQYATGRAV